MGVVAPQPEEAAELDVKTMMEFGSLQMKQNRPPGSAAAEFGCSSFHPPEPRDVCEKKAEARQGGSASSGGKPLEGDISGRGQWHGDRLMDGG